MIGINPGSRYDQAFIGGNNIVPQKNIPVIGVIDDQSLDPLQGKSIQGWNDSVDPLGMQKSVPKSSDNGHACNVGNSCSNGAENVRLYGEVKNQVRLFPSVDPKQLEEEQQVTNRVFAPRHQIL